MRVLLEAGEYQALPPNYCVMWELFKGTVLFRSARMRESVQEQFKNRGKCGSHGNHLYTHLFEREFLVSLSLEVKESFC